MSATEKSPLPAEELRISAIAVSRGVGVGPAGFLPTFEIPSQYHELADDAVEIEMARLEFAVSRTRVKLARLAQSSVGSDSIAGIFDTHLLILESFVSKVEDRIRSQQFNSEWAIDATLKDAIARQGRGSSPHLVEKQLDLKDVAVSIIDELRNSDRLELPTGSVVVAQELRPSALMELARTSPAAIVTRRGGWTSHSSILARELGIPMVVGADLGSIRDNDMVVIDGFSGGVIVRPTPETLASFQQRPISLSSSPIRGSATGSETRMHDGTAVLIRANAETAFAYEAARRAGAAGIGLFRSEILVPKSGKVPGEVQQAEAYSSIADAVGGSGVNIRTFDIGPEPIDRTSGTERNPSLGLRSIRLSLSRPELLNTQLRAIFRANQNGNIAVVIPMVSGLSEIYRFREVLNEIAVSIAAAPIQIPKIGAMIEVPSAVLTVYDIASEVDFLCLGTNDLVQYLLAVDRDNERVADWYQTLHPAVLRAIRQVVAAGHAAGIPVTVCGEMAGSLFYIPLLIGLGARDLSMSRNSVAAARRLICEISPTEAEAIANEVSAGKTAIEIDSALRLLYLKYWPHLFPVGFLDLKHS